MSRPEINVIQTYVNELEQEHWQPAHRAVVDFVHRVESAYRFFLSKTDALLDEEKVMRARAAADPTIDMADEEEYLRKCFGLLRDGFGLLKELCDKTDLLSYEPRVVDPEAIARYTRRVNNFLLWLRGPGEETADPEGFKIAEAELRAAWGS